MAYAKGIVGNFQKHPEYANLTSHIISTKQYLTFLETGSTSLVTYFLSELSLPKNNYQLACSHDALARIYEKNPEMPNNRNYIYRQLSNMATSCGLPARQKKS